MKTIEPLNFSSKAIEYFDGILKEFSKIKGAGYPMKDDPSAEIRVIASMIERAQKFILPDNADLIDLNQTEDGFGGLLKLPYDEVVLEYLWTPDNETIKEAYGQFPTPRRMVLAWNANSQVQSG